MKQSALKRDPEKVREFVERGRTALRADPAKVRVMEQRAREKQLAAARALRPRSEQPKVHRKQVRFRPPLPAGEHVCTKAGCERWSVSWHHWLTQSDIRAYVRSLRIRETKARRQLLADLLGDVRNISPFCRDHHGEHGTKAHDFAREEVPLSAFEFAGELGAEWVAKLERSYRPDPEA